MFWLQALIAYVSLLPLTIVTEFFSVYVEKRFMPNRTFDWKQRAKKMIFENNLFFVVFLIWHFASIAYNRWYYAKDFEYSWTGAQKEWNIKVDDHTSEQFLSEYFQTVKKEGNCWVGSSNYLISSHGDLVVYLCQNANTLKMEVRPRFFWDTFDNGRSKVLIHEWESRMKK
jgi:hypothetical protein